MVTPFDGVVTGHLDRRAAAGEFPELPETLREAQAPR
jgi:hypothetical protein